MKIAIGNDHAGTEYKVAIVEYRHSKGIEFLNFGTDSLDSVDYPDFVHPVASRVCDKQVDLGIVVCGTGNGVAMTANKYQNVRAGLCWNKEIVQLIREHNNANILCLPARFTSIAQVIEMVKTYLETEFLGGRHANRIGKIPFQC